MNKAERQEIILNKLKAEQHVYINQLCDELQTGYDSVRRDINELDAQGLLKRIHGGAISIDCLPREYRQRTDIANDAKARLAKKAAGLFNDGDILLVDGGSTNVELIRQLPDDKRFTIFTNSLPVASEFCDRENLTIHFLGGRIHAPLRTTVGATVIDALQAVRADWYCVGVCAADPQAGMTDYDYDDCVIKRAMAKRARLRLAIVDNSKLYVSEPYVSVSLNEIDYLVVEDDRKDEIISNWHGPHII